MNRLLLALAAAALLSACGVQGDLARPDPLWNREAVLRRECERQAQSNQPQDPRCAQFETNVQTNP
ncbi:MAG: lipoprotein [Hyphomonadaceae bacterium]